MTTSTKTIIYHNDHSSKMDRSARLAWEDVRNWHPCRPWPSCYSVTGGYLLAWTVQLPRWTSIAVLELFESLAEAQDFWRAMVDSHWVPLEPVNNFIPHNSKGTENDEP